MDWQTKRRIIYAFITIIITSSVLVLTFREKVFPSPTCFDIEQNGYETGIDCGGLCDKKCSQEVNPLTVLWSKAVEQSEGVYDLAGLVSNTNIDNASKELGYTFTVYNKLGKEIYTYSGSTTAPLDGRFPVFKEGVPLREAPGEVTLSLSDGIHYRVKESPTSPTVRINDKRYEEEDLSRVYAKVQNTKRLEIRNLEVRAVLFDDRDNAYAVGKTIIPYLPKEGTQEVVFIWKKILPFPPTRIGIFPIFDPFEALE